MRRLSAFFALGALLTSGGLAIPSVAGAQTPPGDTESSAAFDSVPEDEAAAPPAATEAPAPAPEPGPEPTATPPAPAYGTPRPAQPAYGSGSTWQDPPAPPEPPVRESERFSLTLSPLHLFLPLVELSFEVRVVDSFGVTLIGGIGEVPVEDGLGGTVRLSAQEIGAQLNGYPLTAFDELVLGLEALWLRVKVDNYQNIATGVGAGFAVGPFVGYKWIASSGFTLFVQGGVQYIAIRAEAESIAGDRAQDEEARFIPLLNFNLGWSF